MASDESNGHVIQIQVGGLVEVCTVWMLFLVKLYTVITPARRYCDHASLLVGWFAHSFVTIVVISRKIQVGFFCMKFALTFSVLDQSM